MNINYGYYYTNRKINAAQIHSSWEEKKKSPYVVSIKRLLFSMKMYRCYYSFASLKDLQA